MSRGRGFSRGSFRGRGGADGWSNDSGRGRGFSGPSRGRFNWYKEHSSFESRSRYPSGSGVGGSTERYSGRGRGEDASYRRYSRVETPSYSSRDHSHHRSPESHRKRLRTEHGYVQASSSRRSHEGSYGGASDYNNRYGYSEEKGGYGDERGRGYREERRSASGFRDRSREDYPHRKSEQLESSMPPPSSAPPRHLSSPRGSFRGRISRARGLSRMIFPRRDSIISKKRSLMESSYSFRKRVLAARSQAESIRRLKLQRLRRLKEAALSAKKESGDKEGNKTTEEISEEEKEANWDEDVEKADGEEEEEEDEEEELEEGETPDKKEKLKVKEKKKEPKVSKNDDEREEGEEVDDEDEEEDDDAGSGTSPSKKSEVKNDGGVHVTIKQDSDARAVSEEGRKRMPRSTISGRPYIRLNCPHCYVRCITFKEYTLHLYTSKHINMMRKQSLRHKQTLARMRMSQRQKQRLVEASDEVHGSLAPRTNFCAICKLNYRQLKVKHQASESHRAMKKFLMPYCRVCRIGFKSPMLYENHICSLDHLKRKARLEERMMRLHERDRNDDDEGSGMDEKEFDMDNFMILDSVGTVDDTGDEGDDDDDGKHKSDKDKKDGEEKKKTEITLGSEYIKKVEVLFCELCRLYLPRLDQPERALSIHCRTRNHLQRYVRYRDDRALRSKAEKIHRKEKENAAKEAEAKKKEAKSEENTEKKEDVASTQENEAGKETADGSTETSSKKNANETKDSSGDASADNAGDATGEGDGDLDQDLESGMDDKLWADVDKDLGELLREVEPGNKSSDEDDDSRAEGGRYDRFRYSEKGNATNADPPSEGDNVKTVAEADEGVPKSDTPKGAKEVANAKPIGDEKKQSVNDSSPVTASN